MPVSNDIENSLSIGYAGRTFEVKTNVSRETLFVFRLSLFILRK